MHCVDEYGYEYSLTLDNIRDVRTVSFAKYSIRNPYTIHNLNLFIKENRKAAGLTQEEFAMRSGLGLRFVRDLEQGKETVRMDKVNIALSMFDMEAVPGRKDEA